jgi:hypothetical protein
MFQGIDNQCNDENRDTGYTVFTRIYGAGLVRIMAEIQAVSTLASGISCVYMPGACHTMQIS